MADKDLGDSLENMEEGIENLKNKEFRILGIKVTFMSVTALVTVIGTVVGSLYGGFLMYQKIEEAIAFVDQQQEYQELMAGYDERMGIIKIKLEEAVDYTRDIKDGLRADILKTEAAVDRMEDKVDESETRVKTAQASIEATLEGIRNEMNQVEKDVAQSIREVESLNRETEKDVRDTMRATEGRIEEDMRQLNKDIRESLQEALDNPLNDM